MPKKSKTVSPEKAAASAGSAAKELSSKQRTLAMAKRDPGCATCLAESKELMDERLRKEAVKLSVANAALQSEIAYRKQAQASLRADADRLAVLIDIQCEVARAELETQKVMQMIVEQSRRLLPSADNCGIWQVDGDDLVCRAMTGAEDAFTMGMRMKSHQSFSGYCIREGKVVACPDTLKDSRANKKVIQATKTRSLIIAPIHFGSKIGGTLTVGSKTPSAFDHKDIQLLQLMAGLVSSAIDHAFQFEERKALLDGQTAALAALSKTEEKYRLAVRATNDTIWDWDLVEDTIEWSEGIHTQFGYAPSEVGVRSAWWRDRIHRDDKQRVSRRLQSILQSGSQTWTDEYRFRKADGSYAVVVDRGFIATDHAGKPLRMLGSMMDLTVQREAEYELQRILEQTEQILISIPSILIGTDELGCVSTWNAAAKSTLGLARDDVLGRPLLECNLPWDHAVIREAVETCTKEGVVVRLDDVHCLSPSGKDRVLGITVTPLTTGNGISMGLLILGADVTDRRVLERQLVQAQKLESIGQLAAGIAHEINTPIQYVGDNTRFLQDAWRDVGEVVNSFNELLAACKKAGVAAEQAAQAQAAVEKADMEYLMQEAPAALAQSLEGVERVAHIVLALKEFSHPGSAEKTQIDLNHALESTATVARNEWKYVAELVLELDPSLPLISCLPGELNQVFLNLIVNAAQAIGEANKERSQEKGTITISTRQAADCVEIRITDTGAGVPENVRSRLFDPFFTTKDVGKGTGQGLAIARSVVVDKHGGMIDFTTQMGKGTTFVVRLPISSAECKEAA